METYQLFAARDGDILYESGVFEDEGSAEAWAAKQIIEQFGLDGLGSEFGDLVAECDGVLLQVQPDPVQQFAECWALAQVEMISSLRRHFGPRFASEHRRCLHALVDFANAMRI